MGSDDEETSSSTVGQHRLQSRNTPNTPTRRRRSTISTEFPAILETPLSVADVESYFAAQQTIAQEEHLIGRDLHRNIMADVDAVSLSAQQSIAQEEYTKGRHLHRSLMADMDALSISMSTDPFTQPTQVPSPPSGFTLQATFRRNRVVLYTQRHECRYFPYIVERLRAGELDHIWDGQDEIKLAPLCLRPVNVWKRPRESAYYATARELKGEGDVVRFDVWNGGEVVGTKKLGRPRCNSRGELVRGAHKWLWL